MFLRLLQLHEKLTKSLKIFIHFFDIRFVRLLLITVLVCSIDVNAGELINILLKKTIHFELTCYYLLS